MWTRSFAFAFIEWFDLYVFFRSENNDCWRNEKKTEDVCQSLDKV